MDLDEAPISGNEACLYIYIFFSFLFISIKKKRDITRVYTKPGFGFMQVWGDDILNFLLGDEVY